MQTSLRWPLHEGRIFARRSGEIWSVTTKLFCSFFDAAALDLLVGAMSTV